MSRADDIRKEILFQAYALRPMPVSASRIHRECRKAQMDFSLLEVVREIPFLIGDGLMVERAMPGVSEHFYDITTAGSRHYENTFAP